MRALLVLLLWLSSLAIARADVQRFALIIGNNVGHREDTDLAYAESDARKVHAVLRELGGFQAHDMLLLLGEDAASVRRALIALNDRVRSAAGEPESETLLFVYYSGHADAGALRLGSERVELSELKQLVRGSAATFRLLVMDACRSGQMTRVKGGRIIKPFPVEAAGALTGEGTAFLTASAPSEDAQESDEIRGSFFTHAFVSGLLGAADVDGDGRVVLEEAYRYAYDATLRATSRTAYGLQHPSFRYDTRGHGTLVLTVPGGLTGTRGTLRLPKELGFLVMQGDGEGPVVAELAASDGARALSLRAGSYFVRGRARDVLYEGRVALAAGQDHALDVSKLRRVEYARLVRKGADSKRWVHSLDAGPAMLTHTPELSAPCWGAALGYGLDFERLSLSLRLAGCRAQLENALVSTRSSEFDASVVALYAWDLKYVTLAPGLGLGVNVAHQRFDTAGRAPSRTSTAPYLAFVANLTVDLFGRTFARLDARVASELARVRSGASERLDVLLSLRAALLFGVYL